MPNVKHFELPLFVSRRLIFIHLDQLKKENRIKRKTSGSTKRRKICKVEGRNKEGRNIKNKDITVF